MKIKKTLSAFTLLELLVVVGIIGILASLLLVSVGSAKAKAKNIVCVNNLKQHGVGLVNFVSQTGEYPLSFDATKLAAESSDSEQNRSWFRAIDPPGTNFIANKGIWQCPSAVRSQLLPDNMVFVHYGYNSHGFRSSGGELSGLGGMEPGVTPEGLRTFPTGPVKEAFVVNSSEMIAIGDGVMGWGPKVRDGLSGIGRDATIDDVYTDYKLLNKRHKSKANIVFCDGHVEALTFKRLFADESESALRLWNRDNQSHRERLK